MEIKINETKYTIDEKVTNLLDAFIFIKENFNKSFSFNYGCRSGNCGSCSVRVNGVETLACTTSFSSLDLIEPLKNLPIIKDLIVDTQNIKNKLSSADAFLNTFNSNCNISQNNVDIIDIESSCILCNSCYSSCPVYEVNQEFLGPFALVRVYRYLKDKKESCTTTKLDAIQTAGIWDCTLCGACNIVCPQNIDIKGDILQLQNLSVQNGYQNPAFSSSSNFNNGLDSFLSSGFNPNGF
ncbi:MAG: 2Fe-2S iron-sulfur cluster-binding protein [Epsilonproteobacteria bacterium]|nr:2Fe-2S iron-sulfur cluster-binding protein [Campylobacterota bacterium]